MIDNIFGRGLLCCLCNSRVSHVLCLGKNVVCHSWANKMGHAQNGKIMEIIVHILQKNFILSFFLRQQWLLNTSSRHKTCIR